MMQKHICWLWEPKLQAVYLLKLIMLLPVLALVQN